jgi:hypothetical protein
MNQKSQTNILLGVGGLAAVVVLGYLGFDYFSSGAPKTEAATTTASTPAVPDPAAPAAKPSEQPSTGNDAAAGTEQAPAAATAGDANATINAAVATATSTATENASAAGLTADEAKKIGEEVARQVATQVAQSIVDQQLARSGVSNAAGAGNGGLTEAEARRIGEEEGRRVARQVAQEAIQQAFANSGSGPQVAETKPAHSHKHAAAKTEAPTKIASAEAPVAPVHTRSSISSGQTQSKPAAVDALRAWWTPPGSGFGLLYAGQPKGEAAIALLFSDKPADTSLSQGVKVYDAKGQQVSGTWEAAANPRLAVLRGLKPGRYTVVLDSSVVDASGKAIDRAQHGPVYVI